MNALKGFWLSDIYIHSCVRCWKSLNRCFFTVTSISPWGIYIWYSLYRYEISYKSGGWWVYVKATIPSLELSLLKFQFKYKPYLFRWIWEKNWLVISIYRLPLDSLSQFLEALTGKIDFFFSAYNNFIVMGDFNAKLNQKKRLL